MIDKDKSPLVSVVITCYNHVNYIADAVNSVLSQTYKNLELIVVDDGSTDGSSEVLDQLSQQAGFTVIHQKNAGVSAAMNKGLSLCSGEYIATLDSDDMFLADKLQKQVTYLENHKDVAICGGGMLIVDEDGTISAPKRFPPERMLDFEDVFCEKQDIIPSSSALVRREVFDKVGGYSSDVRIQDLYFWLKVTAAGYQISALHDVLIYYRKHESNSSKNYEAVYRDTLVIYSLFEDSPFFQGVVDRFRKSMFVKFSSVNKKMALEVLNKIPCAKWDLKIFKGLGRLLFKF
ncbi:glycosyltransferase [Sansalvadorimonas sp. 2012CJ34-2]|uniref:Glycosyltransferase n=1 Tax=Parendozoicomonas callyspongiae TaxID=2942213 RepID=A0ABT0PLE8_9GAMM|nr:glycosyltransferase [Sansalvadorimonas sp. 2012CJ34-2]